MLQLAALIALPDQRSLAGAVVFGDPAPGMSAPILLQLVAAGLQLATGVAVARRHRRGR